MQYKVFARTLDIDLISIMPLLSIVIGSSSNTFFILKTIMKKLNFSFFKI